VRAAERELLELLTALRATLVATHRTLRVVPGANKLMNRLVADMFEVANDLEREVTKLVSAEGV
jgi:hypothetical protein